MAEKIEKTTGAKVLELLASERPKLEARLLELKPQVERLEVLRQEYRNCREALHHLDQMAELAQALENAADHVPELRAVLTSSVSPVPAATPAQSMTASEATELVRVKSLTNAEKIDAVLTDASQRGASVTAKRISEAMGELFPGEKVPSLKVVQTVLADKAKEMGWNRERRADGLLWYWKGEPAPKGETDASAA